MKLLILRTDIKTKKKVKVLKQVFNTHPVITKWSVDIKDIDNVLRIEARNELKEKDIIHLIKTYGFYSEVLTY